MSKRSSKTTEVIVEKNTRRYGITYLGFLLKNPNIRGLYLSAMFEMKNCEKAKTIANTDPSTAAAETRTFDSNPLGSDCIRAVELVGRICPPDFVVRANIRSMTNKITIIVPIAAILISVKSDTFGNLNTIASHSKVGFYLSVRDHGLSATSSIRNETRASIHLLHVKLQGTGVTRGDHFMSK
jgi:hypothetical protein